MGHCSPARRKQVNRACRKAGLSVGFEYIRLRRIVRLQPADGLRYWRMHGKAMTMDVKHANPLPFAVVVSWLLCAGNVFALDRFAALSMIESGDDDFARGQRAEVSRFQIRSEVWCQATNAPISQATNAVVALAVAQAIARERCQVFKARHGRSATDFEFYVLWNAPAHVDNPGRTVRERAERFVNLVNSQ